MGTATSVSPNSSRLRLRTRYCLPLLVALCGTFLTTNFVDGATLRRSASLTAECDTGEVVELGTAFFTVVDQRCLLISSVPECVIHYAVEYHDLVGNPTASHLHPMGAGGCAIEGTLEAELVEVSGSGSFSGYLYLDQSGTERLFQLNDELLPLVVDIHTDGDPSAEVEGAVATKEPDRDPRVPTLSQWGLFGLTILLLTAGTIVLRNRSHAEWQL